MIRHITIIRLVGVAFPCASLLVAVLWSPVGAADYTASSCNASAIQSLIDNASVVDGDRIIVPAGNCTWAPTDTLEFGTKAVHVRGVGPLPPMGSNGQVVITVTTDPTTVRAIAMQGSTIPSFRQRLSNITFLRMTNPSSSSPVHLVTLGSSATTYASIVDHLTVTYNNVVNQQLFFITGILKGVIYRNILTSDLPTNGFSSNLSYLTCKAAPAQNPDALWARVHTYGAEDTTGESNVYFETNTVTNFSTADVDDACRLVFRYNTITNGNLQSHGFDTSPTGARHVEVYNNTFQCVAPGANLPAWLGMRGGTWVVTDNVIPFQSTLCANQGRGGTATSARPGVWILNVGGPSCYAGQYPSNHQFGWGYDGSHTLDSSGRDQQPEPTYWWNNGSVEDPSPSNPVEGWEGLGPCTTPGMPQPLSTFIKLNRDYFLSPKPGYTKYTYPHPLASQANPLLPPASPTGLTVR